MTPWRRAFREHRWLLAAAGLYCAGVLAEAWYCGVPFSGFTPLLKWFSISIAMALLFLAGMYAGAFFGLAAAAPRGRRIFAAMEGIDAVATRYVRGERCASAVFGFSVVIAGAFFLVSKSLIPFANPPYRMKWDFDFAAWDKALHFGFYPHEFIMPAIDGFGLGVAIDRIYFLWMPAMLAVLWYCIFGDASARRRLRFLWTYFLSWAVIGTVMATWLSSVGPLFLDEYFRGEGPQYDALLGRVEALHRESGLYTELARRALLKWSRNDSMIDANAISAMPSMHIAVCWLMALYLRDFGLWPFVAGALFCLVILAGSVYLGFHYAIDGYVAIAVVSVIWLAAGKFLGRRAQAAAEGAA